MRAGAALAAAILSMSAPARASESDAVRQTVKSWFAKFDAGDGAGALAMCADHGSIIDEFAPFRWSSCADWFKAYAAYASQNGITDTRVDLVRFAHVNVQDGRAYVVGPAIYAYKENGRRRVETGIDVITLAKTPSGWRIDSAAWFGRAGADTGRDAEAVTRAVADFAGMTPVSPPPAAVVDEFPPYHWDGAGADAGWRADLAKLLAADGISGLQLALDKPSQLSVNADWAYAVYPTLITSMHRGKSSAEHGALAFTLQKANDAWRIVSWAWATR
jgi:ketosteroid isomerase-like protein